MMRYDAPMIWVAVVVAVSGSNRGMAQTADMAKVVVSGS